MRTPTIRVGGETLWLDVRALRRGEMRLDRESVSQQCDGCGRDIAETGEHKDVGIGVIQCTECGERYVITMKEIK
jgi:hypothetical protein